LPDEARLGCAGQRAWSAPLLLRHADGRRVQVTAEAQPLCGAAGETQWHVTLAVPPPPLAEDSGFERSLLLARGLDQLPIPVTLCDRWGRIRATNAATEQMVGMSERQLLGLAVGEVEPGVMLPGMEEIRPIIEQVLRTGEAAVHEVYYRFPGELRQHAWTGLFYPLTDSAGRLEGMLSIALDTTEQYLARQRLEVVNEASIRIGTQLDLARTGEELAEVAVDRLADFVTVDLLESALCGEEADSVASSGDLIFRRVAERPASEGSPESAVPAGIRHTYHETSPPGRALAAGKAVRYLVGKENLPWWEASTPERGRSILPDGVHSTMAAPLRAHGTTLGVAVFARHNTPEPFDDGDLLLAEELAARAAVCVDNARRYVHERSTALALQRSLLPRAAPRLAAVDIASRYLPAGPRAGVGGDWFDVIPLSGARVALVVGDVVGHGIQASANMGRLRMAVRTLADVDLAPDELLTQLDDLVLNLDLDMEENGVPYDSSAETSASCLYAVYDPVSGHCSMARAGHPAPALVTVDGQVDFLSLPAGPPLGLGGQPFEAAEFELPDGSVLALFTDGLIQPSLEERCDTALHALLPDRPADDVALLLARTHTLDADHRASWDLSADPALVSEARRHACNQLAAWGLEDMAFITELVVSELVTNAIRYGASPIRLRLIRDHDHLICEVADASSAAPHLRRARVFDEGGRGLMLVAQLTDRWGSRHTSNGKIIWAEQSLPGRRADRVANRLASMLE
jgi:PAS domain S-box-containing protein